MTAPALSTSRWLTLGALLALIVTYSLYYLWLAPQTNLSLWLFKSLPLIAFLLPVWREQVRALQWLAFLVLLYFIDGILLSFSPAGHRVTVNAGLLITALTVVLYSALILYVRRTRQPKDISPH